jgi:hypothetical protein
LRLGNVVCLVRSWQGDGPDLIPEQTDFLALVLRPCDRLHDGVSRPSVAEVEVVQGVAGVGWNPSLVVGRGTGSLGFAIRDGNARGIVKTVTACAFRLNGSYCSVSLKSFVPEIDSDRAACINACSSIGGNAFPLFVARLKIPAQAFAER